MSCRVEFLTLVKDLYQIARQKGALYTPNPRLDLDKQSVAWINRQKSGMLTVDMNVAV